MASAPLLHLPLNLPAFRGLNKQAQGGVLGPEWATRLGNTVLDNNNRVASRKGWKNRTSTAIGAVNIRQLWEYNNSGTQELIASADDNKLYKSTDNGGTWSDVTGTATVTDPNIQFVEFNDVLIGFQSNDDPVEYSGTSFSDLAPTNVAQENVALAAFGRLWAKHSDTVVRYSALLNKDDWDGSDAGSIDLTSVWPEDDSITALASFNGALVIFATKNIVIYTDGSGSTLGLDPVQMFVADTINGIGCVARDSVEGVKGDLWFLDDTGVHSLGRLINERSNPINNISRNVQDELQGFVSSAAKSDVRAVYSPQDRFYLLSVPSGSSTEGGAVFVFDTRGKMEDGSFRCSGIWNGLVPRAVVIREDLSFWSALLEKQGQVGEYTDYQDDGGSYTMEYESGWTDLDDGRGSGARLKLLKRLAGLFFIQGTTDVSFKWAFDFDNTFKTNTVTFPASGTTAEWGISEWNIAEWGGGVRIKEKRVGGRGKGEYIKVGFSVDVDGSEISVQQLTLYAKRGRLK